MNRLSGFILHEDKIEKKGTCFGCERVLEENYGECRDCHKFFCL